MRSQRASIGLVLVACHASASESPDAQSAAFARDVFASRASILIVGDSTNNPRGAANFVPYYEGFIQRLPEEVELCGFRVSGSTGDTGVGGYAQFVGGGTGQMVNGINALAHDTPVGVEPVAPPGYRNQFMLSPTGQFSSGQRFAALGFPDLPAIYERAEQWTQDGTLVLRTAFYTTAEQPVLSTFSFRLLTDHDGSAGDDVGSFDHETSTDIVLDTSARGLQMVDAVFVNPATTRVGVEFRGDTDGDDYDEPGSLLAWCDNLLFEKGRANDDRGIYLDSISVGGFTARDHEEKLDVQMLGEYLRLFPRPVNAILIWLGQNAESDEWNGTLQPEWSVRIESIADKALAAAGSAGVGSEPRIVLCTPPLALGEYPWARFVAMNEALDEIAVRRGWAHLDLQSLIGNSLASIDPGFLGPGPHPSQAGAHYVADRLYDRLRCIRGDFTGDGQRDFFDVSAFLQLFAAADVEADMDGNGELDFFDISAFLQAFASKCL